MTVRVYRSGDFGAPTLSGTAGDLINVLDACLVNGYGSQTITLTRSGTTVTATTTSPHGLVHLAKYDVSGANETDYNGEFSISVTGTSEFTYEIAGTPASPATGTITGKLAGSGWTKPFTGTNKAAYLQGAGGNGHYLRVDDTGATEARVVGYESMSDIDAGAAAFPTEAQISGGLYVEKSSTAGATERDWFLVSSEDCFYLRVDHSANATTPTVTHFGDFESYKAGDTYNTQLISGTSTGYNSYLFASVGSLVATPPGSYVCRDVTSEGTAVTSGRMVDAGKSGSWFGSGSLTYPTEADAALYVSDVEVVELPGVIRGKLKGVIVPFHQKPFTDGDIFEGVGSFAGKTYIVLNSYNNAQTFFEISDTY